MKEGSGMNFIRARGEEQKKIRIQQIVDAAASLYAEVGYDKVTFSQIGRITFIARKISSSPFCYRIFGIW